MMILVTGLFPTQFVYSQFQNRSVDHDGEWHVGEGLEHGDLFSYRMCHMHYKECADFTMDIWIEGDVQSGSETKWLANVVVRDGPKVVKGFMHLNKVWAEPTAGGSENLTTYSSAFKSSIVWMSPFANAIDPKQFRDIWLSKTGPLYTTQVAPKEILPDGLDVPAGHFEEAIMVWGRTHAYDSYTYVVDDFPFPIKATAWQHVFEEMPPLEYRFELLAYQKDVTEDPFADVVPTVSRLAGAGCPPMDSLETSVKSHTRDSEYLLHVFYAPDIPVSGCPMKWQINFLNKLDETEFLVQVQYDLLVLDEDGKPVRSVARDEGQVFFYSPSGLSTIEMTVREEPGTARYAVWVYGLAPESVVPNGTNTDSLQLEIDVDPPRDAMVLPAWIKTTAGFWTSGVTSDAEFVSAIQFLINERVIMVHPTASESDGATEVLQWVKTTAQFWVDGLTTDREFVDAIQFLIGAGIIVSVAEAEPSPSPYQQVRDGTPVGAVVCAGDRMLMLSPSGAPACVFASSVDALASRGFVLASEAVPDAFKTGDRPFATTWRTASPNESITIPVGRSTGAYAVDWGDGTVTSVTGDASHAYASPGEYQVVISGDFTRIRLSSSPNAEKLQSIDQWGDIQWESMNSAFGGATNMVYRATDVPDLSGVTDMSGMFAYADSFNGDISPWDVSGVTDMSRMFGYAYSFNGDISEWDVSGVTDMSGMFGYATSFNGDISEWNVSGVTDMSYMFSNARSFNSDLTSWDVLGVTDMSRMFAYADSFNGDISPWDVSGVTDMSRMFAYAYSFNGDISEWDVSGVTDMSGMFGYATSFNGDISEWNVSGVTDMYYMFPNARSFNSDLTSWDVSGVTDMSKMFADATSFNGDISEWDVSGVIDMSGMFGHAYSFNGDISEWDVSGVTDMSRMFAFAASFNGDISPWDVSGVTGMSGMFGHAYSFTQNLGSWYITLDDTSIDDGDATRTVGNISAQNSFLGGQSLRYSIAQGGDGDAFEIDRTVLKLKSTPNYASKSSYTVTISSTGGFGTSNSETFEIRVV